MVLFLFRCSLHACHCIFYHTIKGAVYDVYAVLILIVLFFKLAVLYTAS